MKALITLQHPDINSGTAVRIVGAKVLVSGKTNIQLKPNVLSTNYPTEIQTNTPENIIYNITGVHLTGESNTLSYSNVLTLYKLNYASLDHATYPQIVLTVEYGDTALVSSGASASTSIPVMLDSFTLPIDVKMSKDGYMPIVTMIFKETG